MSPLTPKALAGEWARGRFLPAYYFFGEDSVAKQLAVKNLKARLKTDDFNLAEFSGDIDAQAAEIVSAASTTPMFSERRLVVVRNLKMGAAGRKLIAEYLRSPLKSTTLVLISPERTPNKKDALAAGISALGGVVLFRPLREGEAASRLQEEARRNGFELEPAAAELLVQEAGAEWGILRTELEKIRLFIGKRTHAGVEDAAACLGFQQATNPFDLPRALQRRDARQAADLLKRLFNEGTDPFRLLYQITSTVTKQFKAKRMLKSSAPPEQIFRELRLQKYYDRDYLSHAERVPEPSLMRSMRACLETEVSLKSQSWLNPKIELQNLVLRVCGK
ncbi:MAG: DNA polymerase III subunit delta [Elusimicrobiota bacterium]